MKILRSADTGLREVKKRYKKTIQVPVLYRFISFLMSKRETDLVGQLLCHDPLRIPVVEMGEVDQGLPHVLVHGDAVRVLHELPDHLALVVLHHQHLLRLGHLGDHDVSHLKVNRHDYNKVFF